MVANLVDLTRIYSTTTGTGTITLGTAIPGYRDSTALVDGLTYSYSIQQGSAYEYGRGTYNAAGQTFTRSPIGSSAAGNAPISLAANAEVAFEPLAEDLPLGLTSPKSLAGNGTTDDRGAIAAWDAFLGTGKDFWLPAGTYRIASNLTIANRVRFARGAVIKPDAGVTVTFSGGVDADPVTKIFDVSNSGAYCWALSGGLSQYSWGAIGDGVTDDHYAFQMLADNQLYFQHAPIRPLPGTHLWASGIILNYGSAGVGDYRSAPWLGPATKYGGGGTFGGLSITYTGWENAIEVTGCRGFIFERTSLKGNFYNWILNNYLGNGTAIPTLDPCLPESWLPSGANPLALSRFKMNAGIHIDPRCGAKPAATAWAPNTVYLFGASVTNGGNLYVNFAWNPGNLSWSTSAASGGPTGTGSGIITDGTCRWLYAGPDTTSIAYTDVAYPPYAGGSTQYNKPLSSRATIRDAEVVGFGCNVAVKGCNASSNGDYVALENILCSYSPFPWSWGNIQARLFKGDLALLTQAFCAVSSCVVGQQSGFAQVSLRNCEIGSSQQMVCFPQSAAGGSVVLDNCYGEVCNRVGDVWSPGPSGVGLKIAGGSFGFYHEAWKRIPNNIINVDGVCLEISAMARFGYMRSPLVIKGDPNLCRIDAEISSPMWMSEMTDGQPKTPITIGEAIMLRSTHSVVFLNKDQGPWEGHLRDSWAYSITSGAGRATVNVGPHAISDINTPIPFCAKTVSGSYRNGNYPLSVALGGYAAGLAGNSSVVSFSETGRIATITLSGSPTAGTAANLGYDKGSVVYHYQTDSLFVVTDRSGGTLTAKRLNDWYASGGPVSTIDSVGTGTWYFVPCGHFVPPVGYEFTYTAGSPAVTFARPDGAATAITDFKVTVAGADYYAVKACYDAADAMAPVLATNTTIATSPAPVNGSFSFTGAARRSTTERAGLWLVPRPPM